MAHDILVLMGATGTGKSALAIELAQHSPAVIINADAMQLYRDLRILTARPGAAEETQAEHVLYGVLPASEATSVARWLELVKPEIERAWAQGKLPMLVGGTGMYIKALAEGLAKIPEIPAEIRARVRGKNAAQLHAALAQQDPVMAERLKPGDSQRLGRALEVVEATGVSLADWQEQGALALFPQATYHYFYTELLRTELYRRLDARFLAMLEQGALKEVESLTALNLPPHLPINRAVGVAELAAYLRAEMTWEEATTKAQQMTRNYAKRQMTWLRNQLKTAVPLPPERRNPAEILRF